jgi:hypothetical protein
MKKHLSKRVFIHQHLFVVQPSLQVIHTTLYRVLCHKQKHSACLENEQTRIYLQALDGYRELLAQSASSTAPGAPPLCHYRSLPRPHLQLGVQLHLQPLCLHTCVNKHSNGPYHHFSSSKDQGLSSTMCDKCIRKQTMERGWPRGVQVPASAWNKTLYSLVQSQNFSTSITFYQPFEAVSCTVLMLLEHHRAVDRDSIISSPQRKRTEGNRSQQTVYKR